MKLSSRRAFYVAVPVCLAAFPASATALQAREKAMAEATRACLEASGLDAARRHGKPIEFDDVSSGHTVLLMEGVYPLPHMRGVRGRRAVPV